MKIQIVKRPVALPQKCAVCSGADAKRDYVDIGLQLDRYGRVYLCSACVAEIAKKTGFCSVGDRDLAVAKSDIWKKKYEAEVQESSRLRNAVRDLRYLDSLDTSNISDAVADARAVEDEGQDNSGLVEPPSSWEPGSLPKVKLDLSI
jgi:hypothetical protein